MTESKQTKLAWPVAPSELITIQSVSQVLVSLIFINLCKRLSKSSYIWNDKNTTQLCSGTHSAPPTQRPDARHQSTHQSPMVAHVNYAKSILEKPAILELLVLGRLRPFNKTEFSIERSFQNCFIFVKAF